MQEKKQTLQPNWWLRSKGQRESSENVEISGVRKDKKYKYTSKEPLKRPLESFLLKISSFFPHESQ